MRERGVALHPSSRKGSPFQAGLGSRQFQASRHPDSVILPFSSLVPFVARFQSARAAEMRSPGKCRPGPTGRPDATYGHLQVLSLPLGPKSDLSRDCPVWAAPSPASWGPKASKALGAQPRRIPTYLRPSLQPCDNSQNRIVQLGPRGLALQALW